MSRFRLMPQEGTCTFQKIVTGRKWVGRVGKCEDGQFFGKIGKTFVYAPTAIAAFEKAVAQHLGYTDANALRDHNAQVTRRNRQMRAAGRYAVSEMQRGNFEPLFNALTRSEEN
jgi:hypothetical protein